MGILPKGQLLEDFDRICSSLSLLCLFDSSAHTADKGYIYLLYLACVTIFSTDDIISY